MDAEDEDDKGWPGRGGMEEPLKVLPTESATDAGVGRRWRTWWAWPNTAGLSIAVTL